MHCQNCSAKLSSVHRCTCALHRCTFAPVQCNIAPVRCRSALVRCKSAPVHLNCVTHLGSNTVHIALIYSHKRFYGFIYKFHIYCTVRPVCLSLLAIFLVVTVVYRCQHLRPETICAPVSNKIKIIIIIYLI